MDKNKFEPLFSGAPPDQVAADIARLVDFQEEGISLEELQSLISTSLLPHLMSYDHPGFQSMFNAFPSPEARLGADVMAQYNQGITNWQVSPGGAVLEELCCQALCNLFGLGPGADATMMYSGTYANQQALYMALHRRAERCGFDLSQKGISGFDDPSRLAALVSRDAHFSLKHAVRMLGLGEACLVSLPLDENRRIDIDALVRFVQETQNSRDIFTMVATAGTTKTGAIDPINAMADMCEQTGAWLHVDGAYGYAYKLIPGKAQLFAGDNRADSIVWDPHKQLGAPIPNSVLFVKQKTEFERMSLHSSYFNRERDAEPNPGLKSPPSTRPMSALPLAAIMRGQGIREVVKQLKSTLDAIHTLAGFIETLPDVDLLHQPELGIICFRINPDGVQKEDLDELNQTLFQKVMATGKRTISITDLDGTTALRLVVVNPDITFEDLRETIEILRSTASNTN